MSENLYDPKQIEPKWQAWWEEHRTNEIDVRVAKNPYYVLMMFPYPSAEGLHVGNVYAFTGADIQGRFRRLQGYDVFEPIGFDAFGIHSENFAMKVNRHPSELIPSNVRNFTRQLKMMAFMFDWRYCVDTTDPAYYKWTQWVFLQLYKNGLAYRDEKEVNFCPDCGTVISDEQVNPDGTCERHTETMVQRRKMPCWFFKITEFADRLIDNHEWLDWSEKTKTAQVGWVGRSKGAEVDFQVVGSSEKIRVFTTRPDTLFGATFMVLAPDHPLVDVIASEDARPRIGFLRRELKEGGTGVPPVTSDVIKRKGACLPHWTQEGRIYSVTFRLADSLPASTLESYRRERIEIIQTAEAGGRPLSEDEADRLQYLFSDRIEKYLDAGTGSALFNDPTNAEIIANALKHFDGERYHLHAWCVMPNHVHVIVEPIDGHDLSKIMHSWKSFTAHELAKKLGKRDEAIWQEESFDHIIRNEASYSTSLDYVWENPDKARLKNWPWRGRISDADHGRDARATLLEKDKSGVNIGARAVNPLTGKEIPIFIADYVMMGYGTGAIMAVPSGDHRDFAFAKKYDLSVVPIIDPDMNAYESGALSGFDGPVDTPEQKASARDAVLRGEAAWSGPGRMINSQNHELNINGLEKTEAIDRTIAWLEKNNLGKESRQYRLRDWGISRQRYWGPPIPILYDEEGNAHPVPEDQLPVELPPLQDFRPKGDGRGPLANAPDWVNVEIDGKKYRRETDVMDNFLDSAWYFLRYPSANDSNRPWDPELIKKWLPVDMYVGGNEHAVLHLLYTRFICMALEKAGVLRMGETPGMKDSAEPFKKFRAHGLLIKEGRKMSKKWGNVVNPDEFAEQHGTDTLRTYLMFLGPYQQGGDFRDKDIQGVRRFFNRVHAYYFGDDAPRIISDAALPKEVRVKLHQTLKKVAGDFDALSYNTAVAALMELLNTLKSVNETSAFTREALCIMIAPFAPHLAEEIWHEALGKKDSVCGASWPAFDEQMTVLDEVEIPIQVNGKVRDKILVPRGASNEELERAALLTDGVKRQVTDGAQIRKTIVVPGRLVNVIIK